MERELLNIDEVAEYLRVSERTVRELIKRGELPATKIGREYRIRKENLINMVPIVHPAPEPEQTK